VRVVCVCACACAIGRSKMARRLQQWFPNVVIRMMRPVSEAPSEVVKFKVPVNLSKPQIKDWLETMYDVSVVKVNTSVREGKKKHSRPGSGDWRRWTKGPNEKVAYVKLDRPWAPGKDL